MQIALDEPVSGTHVNFKTHLLTLVLNKCKLNGKWIYQKSLIVLSLSLVRHVMCDCCYLNSGHVIPLLFLILIAWVHSDFQELDSRRHDS